MNIQTIFNGIFALVSLVLALTLFNHQSRLEQAEKVVKDGGVYAHSVIARHVTIVNPNGHEVVKLGSDNQDSSGYGDGMILVNEGQGLDSDLDKLKASVQIRAGAKLGGLVAAQSYRTFHATQEGRIKLEPIHIVPALPEAEIDKQ